MKRVKCVLQDVVRYAKILLFKDGVSGMPDRGVTVAMAAIEKFVYFINTGGVRAVNRDAVPNAGKKESVKD